MLGIIIGIIGLFFALNITHLDGNLGALILALSSAIAWAISNLIIKLKLQNCDKIQFTAWQMTFGTIALFLYSFCFEHGKSHWNIMSIGYIGVSPPNRSKTLIRNFSPVQELGIKDFLAVFS